jgi:hypothetical protein
VGLVLTYVAHLALGQQTHSRGSGVDMTHVVSQCEFFSFSFFNFFFLTKNYFFFLFNLKVSINLEFYKKFRGIKVILPLFPFDLMPNSNRRGTLYQIRSSMSEIEGFLTLWGSFKIE